MATLTPESGIAAFVSFYREVRGEKCSPEADEDMLLYQWGTYDWGQGEFFDLNITRQLMQSGADDDEIWQLSLTFKFAPNDSLRGLGSASKWCQSPQQLDDFETYIFQSAAYQNLSQNHSDLFELDFSNAG